LLKGWLNSGRDDMRFQRRLQDDAAYWQGQGRPEGLLGDRQIWTCWSSFSGALPKI